MKKSNLYSAPQAVNETITDIADTLADDDEPGAVSDKFTVLLRAIAGACVQCLLESGGQASLDALAQCRNERCCLHYYATMIFRCAKDRLEARGGWAGGPQ